MSCIFMLFKKVIINRRAEGGGKTLYTISGDRYFWYMLEK